MLEAWSIDLLYVYPSRKLNVFVSVPQRGFERVVIRRWRRSVVIVV